MKNIAEKQEKTTNNTDNKSAGNEKNLGDFFIRVGDQYMKEVFAPDRYGNLLRNYVKRDRGTVQEDLGNKNTSEYKSIKKYEGFCLVPSHTNYQQVVAGFFNEYYQLTRQPKEGNFNTITDFLSHVFGDKMDFILDYLQIMYTKPNQRLPIILLESKERGTGKSTFGDLLKLMFEDNAAKLGNSELESDFNAIWVKRLAIIVDETSLEKNGIMQMLKRFSTETGKVTVNEKNQAHKQIDFFGKFIFLSNEEGKALPIDKGETRFAVFKVPTFKERGIEENPNIQADFVKEIPAFFHFLKNRELAFSEVSRMYFPMGAYHTEQLQYYYDNALTATGRAVKDLMADYFNFFQDETEIRLSIPNLCNELKNRFNYLDRPKLKKSLQDEFSLSEPKKSRYTYYSLALAEANNSSEMNGKEENYYSYLFKRESFVKKAEVKVIEEEIRYETKVEVYEFDF